MKRTVHTLHRIAGWISANKLLCLVTLLLFLTPFFWFKPGEIDLGGDGGRLYLYDPVNLLRHSVLYYIYPFAEGVVEAKFSILPLTLMLALFIQISHSGYLANILYDSVKLVAAFLAVYAIVRELSSFTARRGGQAAVCSGYAAILAGLFYVFCPAVTDNFVKALSTQDQVFLNPLMFYLILRFFLTSEWKYVWTALLVSLLFAHAFAYNAAPPVFAFYPLSLLFLLMYATFIRHAAIPWRRLAVALAAFLGLHAFHLLPEFLDLFTPGSNTNTRVFNAADIQAQLGYFYGVLHIPKVSDFLLAASPTKGAAWGSAFVPILTGAGLLLNRKKPGTMLLTAVFFLATLYLVSVNVAAVGVQWYAWLLVHVPGFTMFRNFYGQWQFVFYFFYVLLFGLSVSVVLDRVNRTVFARTILLLCSIFLAMNSWQFITGAAVNPYREEAVGVKGAIAMDPRYEQTLSFIRSLPDDGKILVLPFSDSYVQVLHGLNPDGAYVGNSTISQLTGKNDFAGYVDMAPYSDLFWKLSRDRNYAAIRSMLGLLNIRYIYYNSDRRIYDSTFPGRPYSPNYTRKYLPKTQSEYQTYLKGLSGQKIFEKGFYKIYEITGQSYLPRIYIPDMITGYAENPAFGMYGEAEAFFRPDRTGRPLYLEDAACRVIPGGLCRPDSAVRETRTPVIQFTEINPVKYRVDVWGASVPYFLVLSQAFNPHWKLYISEKPPKKENAPASFSGGSVHEGKSRNVFFAKTTFETIGLKAIPEARHVLVNGYANAWYISPADTGGARDYELIMEMDGQRWFYLSLGVSAVFLAGVLIGGGRLFFRQQIPRKIWHNTD
ncbi:hypothetical protein M1555_02845 [Patescibacteria group bacterium]|nr:hypothetical protein [Patescibacteria group bacterium]